MSGDADASPPILSNGMDGTVGDAGTPRVGGWTGGHEPADGHVVNYVFPVEVIIVGAITDEDRRKIHQQVWADLSDAMSYQNA